MANYNFKSEEDVKQYLENLYVEYSYGCYGEKLPEVCHSLAEYFFTIKKDTKSCLDINKQNCDNFNFAKSCTTFGTFTTLGNECTQDIPLGYKYLKKACELNDQSGCTNAGILAISNSELHQKDKKLVIEDGVKMLNKSCMELRSEKSCFLLSDILFKGIEGFVEKDGLQAYKLSLRSCELGNAYSCRIIGQLHELGEFGVEKNLQLAKVFKKRAYELHKQLSEQPIDIGKGIKP